jgi:hypothetical protein
MSDRTVPPAFKVFCWSLAGAAGGMFAAFRVLSIVVLRFFPRMDPMLQMILLFVVPLGVGMASAVTAGVIAGKATRS